MDDILKKAPANSQKSPKKKKKAKARKPRPIKALLVFRKLLSPLDVYSYLKARFGEPNGLQSLMIHSMGIVREDSANMFQWDYVLRAGDRKITFTGAGREVHVMLEDELSDEDWIKFADELKKDFGNYGPKKSAVIKKWQKWYVFPNRFKTLADRCAELQGDLTEVVEEIRQGLPTRPMKRSKREFEEWGGRRGRLMTTIANASVQLAILTPVLFESFIGLLSAVTLRPEVRRNRRLSEAFQRSPLDVKVYELAGKCQGFDRPIEEDNPVMRAYWTVVNERNDVIHGNVDPVRDALEVVYFEDKSPIYLEGGDALDEFFASLIKQYDPEKVLRNYLLAHDLIAEILNHMHPQAKESIITLMDDSQPGWDADRQVSGKLFPDHVATFYFDGMRYDTDLISKEETDGTAV